VVVGATVIISLMFNFTIDMTDIFAVVPMIVVMLKGLHALYAKVHVSGESLSAT
jgi:hypothetical protein